MQTGKWVLMLTVFRLKDGLAAIIFRWNDGEKTTTVFRQKDGDQNSKQVESLNCACKRI